MADTTVVLHQTTSTIVVEVLRTHVVAVQEPSATLGQVPEYAPVVVHQSIASLAKGMQPGTLVVQPVMRTEVVAVGVQGPPGPPGLNANEVAGALVVTKRLSEYSQDPAAQTDVQRNIGLGVIDPLAHYILAKS